MPIPVGVLAVAGAGAAGGGNFGYFAGGETTGSKYGNRVSTVDKYFFSADTCSSLATGLAFEMQWFAGFSNSSVAAYFVPINDGTEGSTANKFAFATDSRTTIANALSGASERCFACSNSGTAGVIRSVEYLCGRNTPDRA